MKLNSFIFIPFTLLLFFVCCKKEMVKAEEECPLPTENPFETIIIENSSFKKVGASYEYNINNKVINRAKNTFKNVTVETRVEIVLEDNTIILDKDSKPLSISEDGLWKPNKVYTIRGNSRIPKDPNPDYIPMHYNAKPIRSITVIFYFRVHNSIEGEEVVYTNSLDLTEEWKKFKSQEEVTNLCKEDIDGFSLVKNIFQRNHRNYIAVDLIQIEAYTAGD